jgi:hypothetical protein
MSKWLEHHNKGKEAVNAGNYDEARKHFYHADKLHLMKNTSLRHHELGYDHESSDHTLATRYKEWPKDPIEKLEHTFALGKLSKEKHKNRLAGVIAKRMEKEGFTKDGKRK